MFAYLEKEEVIETNRKITFFYEQTHFVIADANLEHYLESVKHYAEDIEDAEDRLFKKAAYLLYHLTYDAHVFTDGNKRTALSATAAFLELNQHVFDIKNDEEMAKIMKDTAEGKNSVSFVFRWLKDVARKK